MEATNRIEFFRNALTICAKFGRSPKAAITVKGQAVSLRQVLKRIGDGARLPSITEAEARTLAREAPHFTYNEILLGLSTRRTVIRKRKPRAQRSQRAARQITPIL